MRSNNLSHDSVIFVVPGAARAQWPPNDPATAATRRADCNRDGPPPFAAAHG
jgi:hypothetical protein